MSFVLGIDGGGTKTHAVVGDARGHILGRGTGPSSNIYGVGLHRAIDAIETAVRAASRTAAVVSRDVHAACLGLSSVDTEAVRASIERALRRRGFTERLLIVNDAELVLADGTPDGCGVALVAGTGSICIGRGADGQTVRAGGWGYLLGDEGSGYRLAAEALSLATQTADGRRRAPKVLAAVLDYWQVKTPEALFARVYAPETTTADIAGLALRILALARDGDRAALGLLRPAAADLARLIETVARRVGMERPPLALGGSPLTQSRELRERVLANVAVPIGRVALVSDPAHGALRLARRLLSSASATKPGARRASLHARVAPIGSRQQTKNDGIVERRIHTKKLR